MAEGYSVRVHLSPAPVLTRVVTVGRVLRGAPLPWLEREVAASRRLAEAGAPVVPPWADPGPHLADGLEVSLWQWVDVLPGEVSQPEVGRLLAALHDALADVDLPLPLLVGPLTDVRAALAVSDDPVLHGAAAALLPRVEGWPSRPLHGDVHTGNLLLTAAGPLWCDLEDVCRGPVEWDLASATLTDEAARAYGRPLDAQRLADCRDLRRLQVLAGLLTDGLSGPELLPGVRAALAGRVRRG